MTSTDGYGYFGPWHYDSAGYLDLWLRFAEAMSDLVGQAEGSSIDSEEAR